MVQQSNINQVQIDLSRDLQVYYKLPFYTFNSPIGEKKKKKDKTAYISLKYHLGSYRETQILDTLKAFCG